MRLTNYKECCTTASTLDYSNRSHRKKKRKHLEIEINRVFAIKGNSMLT